MAMVVSGYGEGTAEEAQQLLDIGIRLGLDPILDIELMWIVQEYQSAPLPDDWRAFEGPDNRMHYLNDRLRYDVITNPIEPRFKKLVEVIKESKRNETPLDEVTVLELIDPIERAADVTEMAEYQGIDLRKEAHHLWIAKLAVLETMPEGWEETIDPSGRTLYRNVAAGVSTDEHPADDYFKALLQRERAKPLPYTSIAVKYFEKPVTHYRKDIAANGATLRTLVEPACGAYFPFYDLYGQFYWYNLSTGRITTDLMEVRRVPAATIVQRIWRGFLWRRRLWELHEAALTIAKAWRLHQYRQAIDDVGAIRERAIKRIQRFWRMRQAKVEYSKALFLRLAEVGARSRRLARIRARTDALQHSGYTFPEVRKKVMTVQRAWRAKLQRTLVQQMSDGPPHEHDQYIVKHATGTIQREFRDMQARHSSAGPE